LGGVSGTARALFLSDCHLGAGTAAAAAERERRLIRFLEVEGARAATIYLQGDLFDFWFEYRHAVPRHHFRVLAALHRLVSAGVSVHFLGGNHDFWADRYLESAVGCRVHDGPIEAECSGRKLYLAHGDGLWPDDHGYRALKAVLRHPWAIAAYRSVHPDWGIPFAYWVSRVSRHHRDEARFDPTPLYEQVVRPCFARGVDAVVLGHYHHPTHWRFGERDFVILGDWVENDSYAVLEDGQFSLWRWREEGSSRVEPVARG
jgi:UDP-2,3-diacylglucosamine hydrolase